MLLSLRNSSLLPRYPGQASVALAAQFLLLILADLRDPLGGLFFSVCAVLVSAVLRQPIFFLMVLSVFFTTSIGQIATLDLDIRLWYLLLAAHLSGQLLSVNGRREVRGLFRPQVVMSVLLLSLAVIVSFVAAPELDFDLARSGVITLSLSLLGLVDGWLWFRKATESERRTGLFVFVLVPVMVTITWLVDKSVGLALNPGGSLSYPLAKENQTAVALLVGLIILLLATHVGLFKFGALATVLTIGISATGSRAVLVMVLFLIPTFLVAGVINRDKRTTQKAGLLTLAGPAGILISWFFAGSRLRTGLLPPSTSLNKEWSGEGGNSFGWTNVRFEAWDQGWTAFLHNPVTGVGLRHSNDYVETLGHLHNSWLTLIVETGLVGLVCAAGISFILVRALVANSEPHRQKNLAAAVFPVAILLAGYNFWDFQILWVIAGTGLAATTQKRFHAQ
jgi:O-antigen ligase